MSYNIDSVRYISGQLTIDRDTALDLQNQYEGKLPESHFLEYFNRDGEPGQLVIDSPWWSGNRSGDTYEEILFDILKYTKGEAELVFIWEGGDQLTGLHVKNGEVTRKKVKHTLG